jgi:CHAD domain-containing protein
LRYHPRLHGQRIIVTLEDPDASVANALAALFQLFEQRLAALEQARSAALVHEARVGGRQLMALLRAFDQARSVKLASRVERRIAALIAELSAARDADVRLVLLAGDADALPAEAAPICLLGLARRARLQAYQNLGDTLAGPAWRYQRTLLRDQVYDLLEKRKARDTLLRDMAKPLSGGLKRFVERLPKDPRSARKQHRLRLQIKTMRYLAEQFGLDDVAATQKSLKRLNKRQRALGQARDRAGLLKWIKQQDL